MPIPLYFAVNCKENVTLSDTKALPFSCGMTKNGELRFPQSFWSETPLLLDDAIPVPPTARCLQKIKELSSKGCILDFERQPSGFHFVLIQKLREMKISPLWLPERFFSYAPNATAIVTHNLPHNSWKQFCLSQQRRFPKGWALEMQPLKCTKKLPQAQKPREYFLQEALCQCCVQGDRITYYDTRQTLLKKLHVAEEYGCQGAIALWSEWPEK